MPALEKYNIDGITVSHSLDKTPNDKSFPLHMHDNFEIFCFVSGMASYMVEGNIYELSPGTVLIMRNSETHKLIVNGNEEYERYTLDFHPEFLLEMGWDKSLFTPFAERALGEKNIYPAEAFGIFGAIDIFQKLFAECKELPCRAAVYSNLSSMLCAIAYAFKHYPEENRYKIEKADIQRELLNYINNNLTKELSIELLSEYVHISSTQLARLFKIWTGTTVHQYIVSKRLILAQRQIALGKTATEAATESGFGDYSCFYRLYKRKFGHSPSVDKTRIEKL